MPTPNDANRRIFRFRGKTYALTINRETPDVSDWSLTLSDGKVALGMFNFGMIETNPSDKLSDPLVEKLENILAAMHGDPNTDED